MNLIVKEIQYGSYEYHESVRLRDKILRQPLGLSFTSEDLGKDSGDIHIAVFNLDIIVGCLILTRIDQDQDQIRMRQVAIDTTVQKMGLGRLLVEASESKARSLGFKEMILHARQTAVPFYLKLNYQPYGDIYTEVSIPHRTMRKCLV